MKELDELDKQIKLFFNSEAFGVIGASANRDKYGNKVVRCYLQHQKKIYPVHANEKIIEGLNCISKLDELPEQVESISIITPPKVTEKIVKQAIAKGIKNIWMQPGAEDPNAVLECKKNNINIISGGPCMLVTLGYKE